MPEPKPTLARPPTGRAADAIIARLEERIVSGALADAKPLPPERDLMAQYKTSRTVIREAISALASRGLVESRPRFRPLVRKPDYGTALHAVGGVVRHLLSDIGGVKNLYDSRLFIERGLVRDAATSARKEDIAALRSALADNRDAIADSQAFYRTDTAFHGVLYRIPRNPIFPAIHEGYIAWLAPQWDKMERSRARNEANYRAHAAILEAILARDPVAAEAALVDHLAAAWRHVEDTFDFKVP